MKAEFYLSIASGEIEMISSLSSEMVTACRLFAGESSIDQLVQIVEVLGPPSPQDIEASTVKYFFDELPFDTFSFSSFYVCRT